MTVEGSRELMVKVQCRSVAAASREEEEEAYEEGEAVIRR